MGAIADLWNSERGLLAILLVAGSTVLTCLGKMDIETWRNYTMAIFGIYAGAKTTTGVVGMLTGKATPNADPALAAPKTESKPADLAPTESAPV